MEKNRDTLAEAVGAPMRVLTLVALLTGCASIQTGMRESVSTSLEDRKPRREIERFKNNRDFVEALKAIAGLDVIEENIFLSENPNAPVIIILGDQHGSSEIEESRLGVLKDTLGVNFVGIEGWTQSMVEKKDMRIVKASEVDVPKMKEEGFNIVGLEDPDLHRKMAEYQFIQLEADGYEALASLKYLEQSGDTSSPNYVMARKKIRQSFDKTKILLAYFGINPKNKAKIEVLRGKILSELGIPSDALKKKDEETDDEYRDRIRDIKVLIHDKNSIFKNPLWIKERDKSAAKLMVKQMGSKDIKAAVIVFGNFHAAGLIEELKSLGDFTIIYIPSPDNNLIDFLMDSK